MYNRLGIKTRHIRVKNAFKVRMLHHNHFGDDWLSLKELEFYLPVISNIYIYIYHTHTHYRRQP